MIVKSFPQKRDALLRKNRATISLHACEQLNNYLNTREMRSSLGAAL
jgi:hypothetical protein